jgi:hypothetical protein
MVRARIRQWSWVKRWFPERPEIRRARDLLAAVDQGGIPTVPNIVHRIARNVGVEVSVGDPIQETIEKIRRAVY